MAKGKHATALFEVIHASKQYGGAGKDRSNLLRTPKWWFKGRPKPQDPTAGATVTSPMAQEKPAAAGSNAAAPAEPAVVEQAAGVAPVATSPADPTQLDEFAAPQPPAPAVQTARRAPSPAVDVDLDGRRQRITFRFTYTSAIVTCFAIAVIVALAYVVGRKMSAGPAQALGGPSTDEIRQGPARPEVMDVGTRGAGGGSSAQPKQASRPAPEPDESTISTSSQPQRTNPAQQPPPARTQTPTLPTAEPGKRVTGLNYVIIQSYPDEASAKAAVDVLKQHGLEATVEKGLRGFTGWHSVVGLEPFARISSPEYGAYLEKIQRVSDKFASRKSFKAFEPRGYKWDRP